jgi:predicted metal-dependent hydrolase
VPSQNLFDSGLLFFNSGNYYQAHEDWEDLWRITEGPLRVFYQGLIQAAVGLHHLQHGNQLGARGQITKSLGHLTRFKDNPHFVDTSGLIEQLQEIMTDMQPRSVRIVRIK